MVFLFAAFAHAADTSVQAALTPAQTKLAGLLSQAADKGDLSAVKLLVEKGAPVDMADPNYTPPLLMASISSAVKPGPYVQIGEVLLAHGADINEFAGGVNAVDEAVSLHSMPFLQMLLAHRPNLELVDAEKRTPLMEAAYDGPAGASLSYVRVLVDHGANVNTVSSTGDTALDIAVRGDIVAAGNGVPTQAPEIVAYLLSHGADLTRRDALQRTPLQKAVLSLQAAQPNVSATNIRPQVPSEAVGRLISHGADPNAQDANGKTALMLLLDGVCTDSIHGDPTTVAQVLMTKAANVNLADNQARTALDYAVTAGASDIAASLVARGANVNATDVEGYSVLMHAVEATLRYGSLIVSPQPAVASPATPAKPVGLITFLLAHGANSSVVAHDGATAISLAQRPSRTGIKVRDIIAAIRKSMVQTASASRPATIGAHLTSAQQTHAAAGPSTPPAVPQSLKAAPETQVAALPAANPAANPVQTATSVQPTPAVVDPSLGPALTQAASKDELATMQNLLERGAPANLLPSSVPITSPTATDSGWTPLMYAANSGDTTAVELLIQHGANVNAACGSTGVTALMLAASNNFASAVKLLLQHGARSNAGDNRGMTALAHSCCDSMEGTAPGVRDEAGTVSTLIHYGALVDMPDHDGNTPLFGLWSRHDVDGVGKLLLMHGASVDRQNQAGETPLMACVGSTAAISFLLQHGADARLRDKDGNTALTHVCANGLDAPTSISVVSLLLKAGETIDEHNDKGETALILAAQQYNVDSIRGTGTDNSDLVEYLLTNGAKVNAAANDGQTALMRATIGGLAGDSGVCLPCVDSARVLLRHGADPNIADKVQQTALMLAASASSPSITKMLLESNAHVDAIDSHGRSALIRTVLPSDDYYVAPGATAQIVSLLLEHKANPVLRDRYGRTMADYERQKTRPQM